MKELYEQMTKRELYDNWIFWENNAKKKGDGENYYRNELAKAHEILGRVVHQASERWDSINITKYYPTDNLHHKRNINNSTGTNEK